MGEIEIIQSTDLLSDPNESRTIKPRKARKPSTLPVVAVTNEHALAETTGTLLTLDSYIASLPNMPRTIVVTYAPETLLYQLHETHESNPLWTWRVVTTNEHGKPLQRKRVAYYGFKHPTDRKLNRYHVVLNASTFFRKHDKPLDDLLRLGIDIREFCNRWGIHIAPSAAGIASQFLKHPMFYPFARRRVPGWLNEEVRPYLPGGHFEAYADPGQRMEAVTYIDQEAAHHYAAMTTPLPNSNSVRVQGYGKSDDRKWARKGGTLYERARKTHGLIRCFVDVPFVARRRWDSTSGKSTPGTGDYLPRITRVPGKRIVHLWSNEIPHAESLGVKVEYIVCTWGTEEVDNGLSKYAQWAMNVTKQHPELKAMLLMPYGLLARHPSEMTYYHPHGDDVMILANQAIEARGKQVYSQADTGNALQLGLIQAFVRSLSLDMARQLADDGNEIVSVYADGIFVKLTDGKQMPIFAPWRVKEEYLELEINDSLRVPRRAKLRRDYVGISHTGKVVDNG